MAPRAASVDHAGTPEPVSRGMATLDTLRIGVKAFVEKDGEKRKAEILSIQSRKGQPSYYVHYEEFNKRLDEWVSVLRLDLTREVEWPQPEAPSKKSQKQAAAPLKSATLPKSTIGQKRPRTSTTSRRDSGTPELSNSTGNVQPKPTRPSLVGGKENDRPGSDQSISVIAPEITTGTPKADDNSEDLDIIDLQDAAAAAKASGPPTSQGPFSREEEIEKLRTGGSMTQNQTEISRVRNLQRIQMGKYEMEPWYFSPYPQPFTEADMVYICEFCLSYYDALKPFERHRAKCTLLHPPGNEIYRDDYVSFFEIDGRRQRRWCRNLCLLSKLFLDHKTLYYDVDPFLFYCMTTRDSHGCHLVGYFSKEKESAEGYNVACILTLPQYQRMGFGKLLIAFSYELSKREGKLGSPEKPLSDLGLLGYRAYWAETVVDLLTEEGRAGEASVEELGGLSAMTTGDVLHTLQNLNMLRYSRLNKQKGNHVIVLTDAVLQQKDKQKEKERIKGKRKIDPERLIWKPPVFTAGSRTWNWRASKQELHQKAFGKLLLSPTDLYLPWLCPALYTEKRTQRSSSTIAPSFIAHNVRSPPQQPKRSSPSRQGQARGLASATNFDRVLQTDEYVPFDGPSPPQPLSELQFPWLSTREAAPNDNTSDTPLIINDSLTTRNPRFKAFDALSGELSDLVATMKACLHVDRFERAAALMRRVNSIYQADAPGLLAAHNDYIRELAWKVVSTKNQQVLRSLQTWFEVELRGRSFPVDATTYAYMIQAALQDISTSKSSRSLRRYLHLAESDGLRIDLMNTLITVLNEQDFGRVTRIDVPEPTLSTFKSSVQEPTLPPSPSQSLDPNLPKVRPVNPKLPGWRALRQSLSVFSDPSTFPPLNAFEGTTEEKTKRLAIERQLRLEKDTYESAIERWRGDSEQLKRMGINSKLKHTSFGALMWRWHETLEPAIRKEIMLANEAENIPVKKPVDLNRCLYGPFLQYLKPEKLSAITILSCMLGISSDRNHDRGTSITRLVMSIGTAIHDESVAEYLKTNRSRPDYHRNSQLTPGSRELTHKVRRERKGIADKARGPGDISAQALEGLQWSGAVRARIGALLLSILMDNAKLDVHRKEPNTGKVLEELQPAFLHQYVYFGGRRRGVLVLNGSLYDRLSREPVAATLEQKHLPMIVEPKQWTGFRNGGFLTSTDKMVRLPDYSEQNRRYIRTAIEDGDMDQVSAGLDVLARTPWQINGPVFEVMLEAWNRGEAIGEIAPDNPHIEMPLEPIGDDKREWARYLDEVKRLTNEKNGYKSVRCFQNFQMEIARAFVDETFYFPHNVDFRGRAYPMSPFLNYMGADLSRGMLTFGIGKELGPSGLKWLKIHLANLYGYDKASFAERVMFAENNLTDIFDSANQPLEGRRWWLKAEDPWQCLAACKELHNALKSPDPHRFVSKLAIHQDGTCNGLQHYAALGGDSLGAKQVNLEPADRPSDIYTGVAELVKEDIDNDAKQGIEMAIALEGKITRKVVKQTVMTNVYGVTFMGAQLQVIKQLKELYPDFPRTPTVNRSQAGLYIVRKIFMALANIFNGAHDIQYWLGDCAGRIAASFTPEQVARVEAARAGSLDESEEFRRTPLKGQGGRGTKDEPMAFKQSVIWTSPLKMPVVQPYRENTTQIVATNLQSISLTNPSLADPVNKRKQLSAFPPNFIHSLDATHMLLSALACDKQGLTFSAVHDSFWTHAADVDTMNRILRDCFIKMHSEDIIGRLGAEFAIRYKGCMHLTAVKASSHAGKQIRKWRRRFVSASIKGKALEKRRIDELLLEYRRLKLLASEKPEERKEGEGMVTAGSIFEQSAGEDNLTGKEDLEALALGNMSPARENKLQADERLVVGDEDNIGMGHPVQTDEMEVFDQIPNDEMATMEPVDTESTSSTGGESKPKPKPKRAPTVRKTWLWRPLTFPPVPKKGDFDVSRVKNTPSSGGQLNCVICNMSNEVITTISPTTNTPVLTRNGLIDSDIALLPAKATQAFNSYRHTPLKHRQDIVGKALKLLNDRQDVLAHELAEQMGRPIAYGAKEITTAVARGQYLLKISDEALKDTEGEPDNGFKRYIRKLPVGPVLILFAWNYPYLILVNSLIPALLAGNSVILKPSPQTPTIVEHISDIFSSAGLPPNVIQYFHCGSLQRLEDIVKSPQIRLVCFTGSVAGGLAVQRAAADRIVHVGLELGGKDPAYVRADVDIKWAAEEIVDGAVFNSGQSCCSIERVYVAEKVHDQFVTAVQEVLKGYKLGSPFDKDTNVGPVVSKRAVEVINAHIRDALEKGATNATPDNRSFRNPPPNGNYVPPTLLTGVTHDMDIMNGETFGPIIPVMKVGDDEEAVRLMNDSEFGLTASIWTSDVSTGERLAQDVEAGTVFVNRCDYPSPDLAWTGWKNSGKGVSLSKFGFEQFVRLKSFHLKDYPR
ncbi:MAG: hypothetical protein Q9218_003913 [Villophora microphyllina]